MKTNSGLAWNGKSCWLALTILLTGCPSEKVPPDTGECGDDCAAVEHLPACTLAGPGDRLDLEAGCADGVCVDDLYADFVETLGDPDSCNFVGDIVFSWYCDWQDGMLRGQFLDGGGEGPGDDAISDTLLVYDGWGGTDPEGLGPGISMSCFFEELGSPEYVYNSSEDDGTEVIDWVWYDEPYRMHVANPLEGDEAVFYIGFDGTTNISDTD